MNKKTVHVYIKGKVQGVFFRANTKEQAEKLGIHGWVRNLNDGRVEAVFEGEADAVEALISWCQKGPPLSHVQEVTTQEMHSFLNCAKFKIKR
ncbi:MAG: acylphosphatase [Candidatus Thermoplasmatota archaeon]|nr:acylphosphatase [Candidatus Thermoplasmatota archaeon]